MKLPEDSPTSPGTNGGVTVVCFAGSKVSLDEQANQIIRDQLLSIAEDPSQTHLQVDFSNVYYVSSAALDTMAMLHKKLSAVGRRLILRNLTSQVYEVFALAGLDKLLDLRAKEPGDQLPADSRQGGSPTGVLVVDDEAALCSALESGLRRHGYQVWSATHGLRALELYRRHKDAIGLVLLDVVMPGIDGPHTLTALQKVCPTVQCCFMTGNLMPYTAQTLFLLGAARIFQKPFALAEIIATLKQLANHSAWGAQDRWIEIQPQRSANDVDFESKSG